MGKKKGGGKQHKNNGKYSKLDDINNGTNKNESSGSRNKGKRNTRDNANNNRKQNNRKQQKPYEYDALLRERVEADGSKSIMDMHADGNCLFRSVSDQLYRDFGNRHAEVRSDVCDYLEAFEDDFSVFLVFDNDDDDGNDNSDNNATDFDSYVHSMREDGMWGGNLELVAASRLYRRNVVVYQYNARDSSLAALTIEHNQNNDSNQKSVSSGPDILVSYHDENHYNSVRDHLVKKLPIPIRTFERPASKPPECAPPTKKESAMVKTTECNGNDDSDNGKSNSNDTINDPADDNNDNKATIRIKKNDPCPCQSGLRYKKCCHAKQKHHIRLERMKREGRAIDSDAEDDDDELPETSTIDAGMNVLMI